MSESMETTVIAEQPGGRNPLVLVAAVAGAVLAAVLIWFFAVAPLLAGDEPDDTAAAPAATVTDDAAAAAPDDAAVEAAADAAVDEALPIVTYEVFIDRDPFEPVVPEPASATADVAVEPVDGTDGSVTDGTTGGTTDGTTGEQPEATDGCTTGDQVVCDGRVVSLVDIKTADDGTRVAIIQVDTTLYEVGAGQVFAGAFQVQSISGDRVFLLYGDDAFELQEGDRVLK